MSQSIPYDYNVAHMREALRLAGCAFDRDEVPIGAVVVDANGAIIGRGYNQIEHQKSQCAHAEMVAIHQAATTLNDWRLDGCTIYVSVEPCSMCYSLLRLSRVETLVYGATSPRFGYQLDNVAISSVYKNDMRVVSGVCAVEAQSLMKQFFQKQRMKKGEYKSGSAKDQNTSH